jgi:hypothetical protein
MLRLAGLGAVALLGYRLVRSRMAAAAIKRGRFSGVRIQQG